ncbi:NUDIX hydrolase [Halobacterium sp. CBA1126]|uniref:NUDIX hydrolase n=1 Tax=Halobacterium sp. CBA1126 TaxID=2668074 RepID=UPI0012F90DFF|nr:NUDIX domain-containing protein [Halobacterium sp. CBA1126]
MSPPSSSEQVRRRLADLERDYGAFDVVDEETVVPRAVYTDCLQAAEAGSLGGARVVLRHDGAVLLVRYGDQPDAWDFPGGSTERGESHADTAKFRVHEDVGATCTLSGVARVIRQSFALVEGGDGVTGLWVFFEGDVDDRAVSPSDEILESRWFDPADPPDAIGPHVSAILDD